MTFVGWRASPAIALLGLPWAPRVEEAQWRGAVAAGGPGAIEEEHHQIQQVIVELTICSRYSRLLDKALNGFEREDTTT